MNFIINGAESAGSLNGGATASGTGSSGISLLIESKTAPALFGIIKSGGTGKSSEIIKPGDVISADLINASIAGTGGFNGILDINGSLLRTVITEDLFNEFIAGKTFNADFNIPVKLKLESITGNTGNNGNNVNIGSTGNTEAAGGGGAADFNIVFKVLNGSSGENAANIQKTLDLYGKVFAGNIQNKIGTALKSVFSENSELNSGFSNEIQNILQNFAQNISVSVKGNFAFIHINLGGVYGLGSVILTTGRDNYNVKSSEDKEKHPYNTKKKYMFMLEINLKNIGRIKLFSYYSDKTLSVKFDQYPQPVKKLIAENLELFKEMMSEGGIRLSEVSFKNPELKRNGLASNGESSAGTARGTAINETTISGGIFSNGKIIDERI